MGMSRIEITTVGNHGCGRDAKEGEEIPRCGSTSCIDCQATAFVAQLKERGAIVEGASYVENVETGERYEVGAVIRHWPGDSNIVDDLVTGVRKKGSF